MIYWISYVVIKLAIGLLCPYRFVGREHIPDQGGFIIASNHRSNLDPFLVGMAFHRRISYLAKEELFRTKLSDFFFRRVGAFPVRRGTSDLRAFKEVLRRLKAGSPVLLFPEGTRTLRAAERKVQAGVGLMALKSGAPVVPVYIQGSDQALPPGAKWPRRKRIMVRFGRPLRVNPSSSSDQAAREIMRAILDLGKEEV